MRRLTLVLCLLLLPTCLWATTRVTRTSATEFRVQTPIIAGVTTQVVEWWVKTTPPATWTLQGIYARDLATGIDVQLSDAGNNSVYEYAFPIAEQGAGTIGFEFFGNGHGHETPLSVTMTLDGASVLGWSNAQTATGATFIIDQSTNTRLPLHANGTVDDVTIAGSSTLRHTFTDAGLLVEHTHVMSAGFVGKGDYAAMCPASSANFNRVRHGSNPPYTPHGAGAQLGTGTQAATYTAWHTSAHPYRLTMTLPSGGPDTSGSWTNAGPENTFVVDNDGNIKFYAMVQGGTLANARNLGSTAHAQTYAVDLWVPQPVAHVVTTNLLITGGGRLH
jgi:hypothetical protein